MPGSRDPQLQVQLPTEGVQAEVRGPESRVALQRWQHQPRPPRRGACARPAPPEPAAAAAREQKRCGAGCKPRALGAGVLPCCLLPCAGTLRDRAPHSRNRAPGALSALGWGCSSEREPASLPGTGLPLPGFCKVACRGSAADSSRSHQELALQPCRRAGSSSEAPRSRSWWGGCRRDAQGLRASPGGATGRYEGSASGDPPTPPRSGHSPAQGSVLGLSVRPGNEHRRL